MYTLNILNSKQKKAITQMLDQQWGFSEKLDYVYILNRKNRLFLVNRDIERLDTKGINIDSIGLYVGEILHEKEIRLSIEGSQIIGPRAKHHVVDLDAADARLWLKGNDIPTSSGNGFVIIRHEKDFLGCGRIKEGNILNFVPKTRRILAAD